MDKDLLEARRSGIGGSDMPSILGICPYGGSPYGVWQSKVFGSHDTASTPDMQRGNFLEPIIRDLYRQHTGHNVQSPGMQRSVAETWAIANVDGLVIPATDEAGILEIKAPRIRKFLEIEEDGVPVNYIVQCQHYMGVTGLLWCDFCAWNADVFRLHIVRIQRDNDLIRIMWDIAREFWNRHVVTRIPPDTGTVLTGLKRLEPQLCRMESPEWTDAAQVWREARNILKEVETYEAQCKERLVHMAIESGKSKVKGADVSVSIDKNGVPRVRDNQKEEAA